VAENKVILEFVGDVSGLKPAIDTLSQLGNLSEEQVTAFKKANEQFAKASQQANNTEKSVSKLATSFKQVSGAVAGKAIVEPLQQMSKAAETSTQKIFKLATQLAFLRKEGKENTAEFKALQQEINKIDASNGIGGAVKQTQTLKSELRQLQNELQSGKLTGAEFDEGVKKAALMKDQIIDVNNRIKALATDGVDVALKGFGDLATGVLGAFSAAQGAVALFGDENEDLQKALLKVQGAMALLNGVQAVNNTLQSDSAFRVALSTGAMKLQTFVATGATAAVRAFNAALIATGVGAAIAALGAIVAYWEEISEFIGISNKGLKEQQELEKQLAEDTKKRKDEIKDFNKQYEGTIGQARLNLELLEKQKASEKEILNAKKFLNIAEQEVIKNKLRSGIISDEEKTRQETILKLKQAELIALNKELAAINQIAKKPKIQLEILGKFSNEQIIEEIKKAFEAADKELPPLSPKIENIPPIKIDIDLQKAIERQKYFKEQLGADIVQGLTTAFDAAFQIAANNRGAQFEEEQRQLDQRREQELSNKNLTESQKAAIEKKYQKEQAALRAKQFRVEQQAAIAQAIINGALAIGRVAATNPPLLPGGIPNPAFIAGVALATITTGAQIAVISSQKAPKFAKGGWIGGKPHSQGGTLIEAEKDEFMVRKSVARQNKSFLEAFNNTGNVAKALDLVGFMPSIKDNDLIVMENKTNIDYSKLGRAVAREMSKLPQSELEVNYRGLLTSISGQQSLIEWQKRKYN
jgi:hypothetical protein